ncbi:oxysterol-binding protein, putative [Ichthyophthirius multifiliis]|uniref:Oxysterol-binding protein, putative n=1 Tax=Ichthyophthirius multifiliis TaxID=5932 RepID=G0QKA6_ICHMU|nr:oxysterol-binding protein, putative [Ichthyophthirius multifiliis]EGR34348.1 oxysterol-binding protein, putative [Ichthyophthirius multifiliis]|eukprot:XP_004039652.1 oxysterol-binding protein, putative [Ichthyophthirius multifiliis]
MEGYLNKWINIFQQWKERYFILHEDCLHYCDVQGGQIKGTIHLKIANIAQVNDDPLRIIINSGTSQIEVKAHTVSSKLDWLKKLKEAQEYARSQFDSLTKSLQECILNIENERKRIYRSAQLISNKIDNNINMNSDNNQQLLYINSNSKNDQINEQYYTENGDEVNITQFESFIGDDLYYQKNLNSQQQLNILEKNEKIIQIPDQQQQNFNMPISQNALVSFFQEKCQIRYRLLSSNPSYLATQISNEPIRMKLPKVKDPNEKINIWSILKDSIGKDLSKFAVPVYLNEPISMLQRLAEQMEYSQTLDNANATDDTCLALCYAMGFAASVYAATINRTKKPFNPLLGETFEFIDSKNGFRFISEQVSHHPPISAGIGESNNYIFQGDSNITSQFWGKSFEVKPLGHFHIKLKRLNHDITFKKCTTAVKNIFIGQMYLDHYGVMEFKNHSTGDFGELNFREKSAWSDKGQYEIEGFVSNKQGQEIYKLKGKWNSNLTSTNITTGQTIEVWKRYPLPQNSEWNYHYTQFALQLNHLNQDNIKWICPTDSRLRPDQRALEYGLLDVAADEKFRLEQKQRARRKENEASGKKHEICFFEQRVDQLTGELEYKYKGGYWETREKQDWNNSEECLKHRSQENPQKRQIRSDSPSRLRKIPKTPWKILFLSYDWILRLFV